MREVENSLLRPIQKTWNVITSIIVILMVVLAIALVGVRLVGLQVYTVLSGSMEPAYLTGSLIYVKQVEPSSLNAGDVITFMANEKTVVTHRIVDVLIDEADATTLQYRTKGDANNAIDGGLVHYKNVLGSPVFTIPYLGYVANYVQNPPGMYLAIAVGAILILLVFLSDMFVRHVR